MNEQLHIEIIGDHSSSDTVLVFLHDAIGSVSQWKDFPQLLCKQTHLPGLLYDRSGHGTSGPLTGHRQPDYMHRYAWEELAAVVQSKLRDKKLILVGHSDGGSIALLFASQFPQQVKAIITMAAHVFVEEITLEGIRATRDTFAEGDWMDKLKKHHGNNTESIFEAWWKTWLSPGFRNWNIEDRLTHVVCPVFAIQAKDDNYGSEKQVDAILHGISGGGEKWMIDGKCGHAPWKSRTNEVVSAIAHFIHQYC